MAQTNNNERGYTRRLVCADCDIAFKIPVPMIKNKNYQFICSVCIAERKSGIETRSRFLRWLRKRD